MPKKTRNQVRRKRRRATAASQALELFSQPAAWHQAEPNIAARIQFAQSAIDSGGRVPRNAIAQGRSLTDRVTISGGVATIPITGAIWPTSNFFTRYYGDTACSELTAAVRSAASNEGVQRIMLVVDSPGGSVLGLEETATVIQGLRDQKPIEAVVVGLCASAAYYLASAASEIHAQPSTTIGSIGTIYHHQDWTGFLAGFGVKITPITHGRHKADGSPFKPLDAQGRQTLQDWVDSFGQQFTEAVARHRGVDVDTVRDQFGQGKFYIASRALELGLIDGVATLEQRTQAPATATDNPPNRPGADHQAAAPSPSTPDPTASAAAQAPAAGTNSHPGPTTKDPAMPTRIKALLFALELIGSQDASDDVCQAAVSAFCRARGVDVPDVQTDEGQAKLVALLTGQQSQPDQAGQSTNAQPAGEGQNHQTEPTNPIQAAHNAEQGEARQMTARQFMDAQAQVQAAAALVNAGRDQPLISAQQIDAACRAVIEGTKTLPEIQADWKAALESDDERQPVSLRQTGSGAERFADEAEATILARAGMATDEDQKLITGHFTHATLLQIAEGLSQSAGGRGLGFGSNEQRALEALQGTPGISSIGSIHAGSSSFNRPGDFPNFMSNLAGKILDRAIPMAEATYTRWTDRVMDLPDFKPSTIIGAGVFDQLDLVMDDEEAKQLKMAEELKGWIMVRRYANRIGLTPVMVANDDLDGFVRQLQSLAFAHEITVNTLCVEILTKNVELPDGDALYHSNHGNTVTGGGAPSATQAESMRKKHRKQTGIGTSRTINSQPRIVLVPTDLEDAAYQTYYSIQRLNEVKIAETDANINVHRGTVRDVVVEPELDGDSTTTWYTFDDPSRFRVVAHAFQTGYGRGGRRTSWFDPSAETRWVKLEGRMGAAAAGYRGTCRNET